MKQKLTLRRRGEFKIRTSGQNHCGVVKPVQPVRYEVEVVCKTKLDGRGFLFEQRNVDEYFQGLKTTSSSCELLTQKCADELIEMIKDENPFCKIKSITVRLCAAPYLADMTFTREF